MKAMIFAAGLGTRLKPLTDITPKALIEVNGVPMIEHVIRRLKSAGVTKLIINLHHFPDQIKAFLASKDHFGLKIVFSEERDEVLETGGGLMKASALLDGDEPFFVHNTDVISNVNLKAMWDFHQRNNPLATLLVQDRPSSRYLLFDEQNTLKGWTNTATGEMILVSGSAPNLQRLAFNGIHIIRPDIFRLITKKGKFSIIKAYLDLARDYQIKGLAPSDIQFVDVGKPENIPLAESLVRQFS